MIERAIWRLRPDDPKTPLGWLFGVDRYRGVPLYPVLAGSVLLMALLSKACEMGLPLGIGREFLPTIPVFVLVTSLRSKRREALAPDPAPRGFIPARCASRSASANWGRIGAWWLSTKGGSCTKEGRRRSP